MADQDETRKLLWMFRQKAPEREPGEVEFDAVDAIYLLQKNTNNPYLKRAIAPSPRKLERSPGDLSRLVRFFAGQAPYQVAPSNENRPFAKRTSGLATAGRPSHDPRTLRRRRRSKITLKKPQSHR